jgi:hypothetical protein
MFNGSFGPRLSLQRFETLEETKAIIEDWQRHYILNLRVELLPKPRPGLSNAKNSLRSRLGSRADRLQHYSHAVPSKFLIVLYILHF